MGEHCGMHTYWEWPGGQVCGGGSPKHCDDMPKLGQQGHSHHSGAQGAAPSTAHMHSQTPKIQLRI